MSWLDLFKSKPDGKKEGIIMGQGGGKKSENKGLMDDIMNPNSNGGSGRGPNSGHNDKKKEK